MATYTKVMLSGSTNGKAILTSGSSAGTVTVHTTPAGTTSMDEIWLWAVNTSSSPVKLTIEFGETTAPNGNIEATIPGESGPVPIVPGWLLNNGLSVTCFADTINVITIFGFVNRITN